MKRVALVLLALSISASLPWVAATPYAPPPPGVSTPVSVSIHNVTSGRERSCLDLDLDESELRICATVLTQQGVVSKKIIESESGTETIECGETTCTEGGGCEPYANTDDTETCPR